LIDIEEQNRLISKVIERVYIDNKQVVAITFKGDSHTVLTYGADTVGVIDNGRIGWSFEDLQDMIIWSQAGGPPKVYIDAQTGHEIELDMAVFGEIFGKNIVRQAHLEGFEPPTFSSEGYRSIR
jgi:hypothetical protein